MGRPRKYTYSEYYERGDVIRRKKYWHKMLQEVECYEKKDGELVRIPLAQGTCKKCNTFIKSKWEGDFVVCPCGTSFVDTSRGMPDFHRYGGEFKEN